MLKKAEIVRLVAANKNLHTLCRCISRGADGQWKTFVDGKWLLSLPEFDDGIFPETIKFEHRRDPNALYFGPAKTAHNQEWWSEEQVQRSLESMIGTDSYTFTSKNFSTPTADLFGLGVEGLFLGKYFWRFENSGFMKAILKYEPFNVELLQGFHMNHHSDHGDYRATRIVSPHRDFYVMMEEL